MFIKHSATDNRNHTFLEPTSFSFSNPEFEKVFFGYHLVLPVLFLITLFVPQKSFSQADKDSAGVMINYQYQTFSASFSTNGFGVGYQFLKYKNYKSRTPIGFDFGVIRHQKEERVSNRTYSVPRGYIFGKINEVFYVQSVYGIERMFIEKSKPGSIGVNISTMSGLTIGFQKPIYYRIIYPTGPITYDLNDELFDPEMHTQDNIYGKSSFFKGFDEVKVNPGIYFKTAFCFDYAKNMALLHRIETGLQLTIFLKPVEIMALVPKQQLFFSFFASYRFGIGV